MIRRRREWRVVGEQRGRYEPSGRSRWQCLASPSAWQTGFPPDGASCKPLAVGSLRLRFPLEGMEGVMPCSRSREDLVAVVPLICNQYPRLWKRLKQQLSSGEVAALPFAELKEDRWSLLVSPRQGRTNQGRGSAPFLRLEAVRCALTQVSSSMSTSSVPPPASVPALASGSVAAHRAHGEKINWKTPFCQKRRQRL